MNPHHPLTTLSSVTNNTFPYNQPQLLSLLMNSYMKQTAAPMNIGKTLPSQDQQRTYVNALVDVTVQAIVSIWPNSNTPSQRPIANLNTFLHHILKHSRTTHSTLQLAIFYLFRIRPKVQEQHDDVYISCGRRMFLAALICAHKFLQDKTYKNSAWSKVSGLDVSEINHAEKVMLQLLDYHLFVKKETYDQWVTMLQTHLHVPSPLAHHPASLPTTNTTTTTNATTATPSSLPSPVASPVSSSNSPSSNIVHSVISSTCPLNKMSSTTTATAAAAMLLGMPTPVEDRATSISPSPVHTPQRKRKASMDQDTIKKRRC